MVRKWSYLNHLKVPVLGLQERNNLPWKRYRFRIFKNTTKIRSKKFSYNSVTRIKRQKIKLRRSRRRTHRFNSLLVFKDWEVSLRKFKQVWRFYANLSTLPSFSLLNSSKIKILDLSNNVSTLTCSFVTITKLSLLHYKSFNLSLNNSFIKNLLSRQLTKLSYAPSSDEHSIVSSNPIFSSDLTSSNTSSNSLKIVEAQSKILLSLLTTVCTRSILALVEMRRVIINLILNIIV